jgi:hypothetical protein
MTCPRLDGLGILGFRIYSFHPLGIINRLSGLGNVSQYLCTPDIKNVRLPWNQTYTTEFENVQVITRSRITPHTRQHRP